MEADGRLLGAQVGKQPPGELPYLDCITPLGLAPPVGRRCLSENASHRPLHEELTALETSSHYAQTNIAKPTMAPRLPHSATAVSIVISPDQNSTAFIGLTF